jgi:phosphoribosylamine--glycine ligase
MVRVLIIGSGGREEGIKWSIAQDPDVSRVYVAPGNAGTHSHEKCENANLEVDDFPGIYKFFQENNIEVIVVGPEKPLVDGISDYFHSRGLGNRIFGPNSAGAQIESDKFFSFDVMNLAGIPQANGIKCRGEEEVIRAIQELSRWGVLPVLKARGLTGGKGVGVYDSIEQALADVRKHTELYGNDVLVSERLYGPEFSVFGISDGEKVVPIPISVQDHKRLLDNDKGPNTGGMAAYCPVPFADPSLVKLVADTMMTPAVQEMRRRGIDYRVFLYAGVIKTKDGLKILEYNCRLGDPETQPLVMMLQNGLYKPIQAALEGKLDESMMKVKEGSTCCIVLARREYPGKIEGNLPISGLEDVLSMPDVLVLHAGTTMKEGRVVTSGGRNLNVLAYGKTIREAVDKAYGAAGKISIPGGFHYRKDIAAQALAA